MPSATPTPTASDQPDDPNASSISEATSPANGSSPPKYREGPRVGKASDPGEDSSTRGVKRSTSPAIEANTRASRSGSGSTMCNAGHRRCASRRRSPTSTPSARAAGEVAVTRFAAITATASSAEAAVAITGQSGHSTTSVRTFIAPPCQRLNATTVPSSRSDSAVATRASTDGNNNSYRAVRLARPRPFTPTRTRRERRWP